MVWQAALGGAMGGQGGGSSVIGDLSSIGGSIGGAMGNLAVLLGMAGPGGIRNTKRRVSLWEGLPLTEFDMSNLTWEDLQVLAKEAPALYQAILPEAVQTGQDNPMLAADQQTALAQMQAIAREGMPTADRLAAQEAQGRVAETAKRAQLNVLRDLAERGRLGAGDELQARLAANQQAGTLARGMASDLARQAADRRMAGISQAGGMAGQIRGQGFQQSLSNANVVNAYNNMVAQMLTQANRENTARQTAAQAANAATTQRIGEQNVLGRYNTNLENLNRLNALRQQQFANTVTKTTGLTGALGDLADKQYLEQAAKASNLQNLGRGLGGAGGGAADYWRNRNGGGL